MCYLYMQLICIREDYFPSLDKEVIHAFYNTFDVKERRGEDYLIDELIRFIGQYV